MKVFLKIREDKAAFILELLKNFKHIKNQPLTPYKVEISSGLKEGVEQMNLIRSGKFKGISARDLLDE